MQTANDFGALDFPVYEAVSGQPLRQMIVFFNNRDLAYKGSKYLKQLLPEASHHEIIFWIQVITDEQGTKFWEILEKEKSVFFVLWKWQEWYDKISN